MFFSRNLARAGKNNLRSLSRVSKRGVHWEKTPESEQIGYDKQGFPVSKEESIFNRYTGTFFGTVFAIVGYEYLDKKYRASHDGESILSLIKKGNSLDEIKTNYQAYRDGVLHREQLHTMFADTQVKDQNNYVTRITDVPGRVQCFNGNGQFNTIHDWENVSPRKQRENPFH